MCSLNLPSSGSSLLTIGLGSLFFLLQTRAVLKHCSGVSFNCSLLWLLQITTTSIWNTASFNMLWEMGAFTCRKLNFSGWTKCVLMCGWYLGKERKWEVTLPIRETMLNCRPWVKRDHFWPDVITCIRNNSGEDFKEDKAQDAHLRINLKFTLHLPFDAENQTSVERKQQYECWLYWCRKL